MVRFKDTYRARLVCFSEKYIKIIFLYIYFVINFYNSVPKQNKNINLIFFIKKHFKNNSNIRFKGDSIIADTYGLWVITDRPAYNFLILGEDCGNYISLLFGCGSIIWTLLFSRSQCIGPRQNLLYEISL